MTRKARNPNFEQTLETLRAHAFDVADRGEMADGVQVSKQGAGAVLAAAADGSVTMVVAPGVLVGGKVSRLIDRGYQKFIKSSQYEAPATASQLHAIHRFTEELKQWTGAASLYNESLGTTSDLYEYDRLKGREAEQPALARPWGASEGH